jgi:fumarate reductase subunit C
MGEALMPSQKFPGANFPGVPASRAYRRPIPATWWLTNRAYFLFMVREFTSVFIAAYLALLLILLDRLGAGAEAYAAYLEFLGTPAMVAFHGLALAAALYHSITWFNLAPKGLTIAVGDRRVPDAMIAGGNYAAWIVVSALLVWIVL